MSKYLVTYHGSGPPPSDPVQMELIQAAFGDWVAKAGKAVVDAGAPLRQATQVAKGDPTPQVLFGGYTIIEAASLDEAVTVLQSHPFVARGGTLQVDEFVS